VDVNRIYLIDGKKRSLIMRRIAGRRSDTLCIPGIGNVDPETVEIFHVPRNEG
jgi:hypothetical protein